jgi:hypothetical protein
MAEERRSIKRRKFGYYMQVVDNDTHELIGYLADISPQGFKLERQGAPDVYDEYSMRLELTPEISDKTYISFIARRKWSRRDPMDPNAHNEGFQIISISSYDRMIYQRIVDKYGRPESSW